MQVGKTWIAELTLPLRGMRASVAKYAKPKKAEAASASTANKKPSKKDAPIEILVID